MLLMDSMDISDEVALHDQMDKDRVNDTKVIEDVSGMQEQNLTAYPLIDTSEALVPIADTTFGPEHHNGT